MNHGAISVIYLALSAVCLIGLYGIYRPNINAAAGNTFDKVERFTDQGFAGLHQGNKTKQFDWNGITCKPLPHGGVEIVGGTPTSHRLSAWHKSCPLQVKDATYIHFDAGSMSNVRSMARMFQGCHSLQSVTATGDPDTSRVTRMTDMFKGDSSLTDISGLSSWDTSNVTEMSAMFENDTSLSDISTLGNWDTSNVLEMNTMFYGDTSLKDVSALKSWNIGKETRTSGMFSGTKFSKGAASWKI